DNRNGPVAAVGAVGEPLGRVEPATVGAPADVDGGEHGALVGVHHDHLGVAVAAAEQAAFLRVDGQPVRPLTGRQRPSVEDLERDRINFGDLARAADVDEDASLPSATAASGSALKSIVPTTSP